MERSNSGATRARAASSRAQAPGAFRQLVGVFPIIPAVRSTRELEAAAASASRVVYLLGIGLRSLDEALAVLRAADKEVVVNIDLCSGLARDAEAVSYLAASGCAGLISTHTDVLAAAQREALFAVQRTFLIDSESLTSCARSLHRFQPDALEILPAPVAPRLLPLLREQHPGVAAVGGGLIADLHEADALLRQGLDALSSGNPQLWRVG